jgi:hypothetical protein
LAIVNKPFWFSYAIVFFQVYGSNDERTVLLTAICGPCEVLHVDRVREETKTRCQLDSSKSRLHPIFFCRSVSDPVIVSLAVVNKKTYFFVRNVIICLH